LKKARLILGAVVVVASVIAVKRFDVVHRVQAASIAAKKDDTPTITLKKQTFNRRVNADGYLRAVKATPLSTPAHAQEPQKIGWLMADGSFVKKGDVVVRFDASDYDKKLRDGEADRAAANAKIDKENVLADSAGRGRTRSADLAKTELDETRKFQATDKEIFSRNQIIESGIDEQLSTARMTHAGDAKGIEGKLSKSKLELLTIEKRSADIKIRQAEQGLQALEIRAPHDGIFVLEADSRGNLSRVGDNAWPGQMIASLPILESMEAEIFILEADASGLELGTQAKVVLEAHPDPDYDAKIRRIDKLAKPRQREVPIQYFGATLELAKTVQDVMKPGERVRATLILDKKDALAVPRQAVTEKDGKTVVYRQSPSGSFEPVTVKLGAASPGLVVIDEGVNEGDRIALRDPTRPANTTPAASASAAAPGAK